LNNYLTKAIRKLRPESEFSYENDDYSTINWITLDGDAPTKAEIDAAIEEVKAEELAKAEADKAKRDALLSKLGITEDEARLLLS
jgi:hypothetical protein